MEENTNFNFSIPELAQRGDKLGVVFLRDKEAFISYGYDVATVELMAVKTEALKRFPSDDYYEGKQKMATDAKNQIRQRLEANISDLRNRAKLCYGAKSVEFSLFRFNRLKDQNDNELVQQALHVTQVAETRLEVLSKRMVTQESLNTILEDRHKLDVAIDEQATAVTERREKKIERTRLANELYKIISELSEVGKMIWKGKNEAYYTDYVIYGSAKAITVQAEETEVELPENV